MTAQEQAERYADELEQAGAVEVTTRLDGLAVQFTIPEAQGWRFQVTAAEDWEPPGLEVRRTGPQHDTLNRWQPIYDADDPGDAAYTLQVARAWTKGEAY